MERTQYDFSKVKVLIAVLFACSISAVAYAQPSGQEIAQLFRPNTVRIETLLGERTEDGFGFVVGQSEEALYAVTAYHVVEQKSPDGPPAKVRVELFEKRGTMIDATILGHDEHDLALISFPAPAGFRWNKRSLGREGDQNAPTKVWFIGKNREWYVPVDGAPISSEKPVNSRIDVEGSLIRPGSSGGPLIASSGIVGLVVTDSENGAQALSIDFVRDEVQQWRQPWNLERHDPNDVLVARGEKMARNDPMAAALRALQPEAARRGFDLGMAVAEKQTDWGPGKQAILDALPPAEQAGYKASTSLTLDRNKYAPRVAIGAKIAEVDTTVALARKREADPRYWVGFDIATAIYGDPKLGAQGNTAVGPGAMGVRNSLSEPAQRGFDAAVKLHLSRKY